MTRPIHFNLVFAILAIAVESIFPVCTIAAPAPVQNTRLAQFFYPPSGDRQTIAVTGQGYARVPADLARIDIVLTNQNPPDEYPPLPNQPPKSPQEPITAESLNYIVAALKAAGVPENKIKVLINPLEDKRFYYNRRNAATIAIELEKPTQVKLAEIVNAVKNVLPSKTDNSKKIHLEDIYVQYLVDSCELVEQNAYQAAMKDAKLRADAIAKAMGVQLADVPSVAELPFIGRFYSPCSQEQNIVTEVFRHPPSAYNPERLTVIEVFREVAVTYRVR